MSKGIKKKNHFWFKSYYYKFNYLLIPISASATLSYCKAGKAAIKAYRWESKLSWNGLFYIFI